MSQGWADSASSKWAVRDYPRKIPRTAGENAVHRDDIRREITKQTYYRGTDRSGVPMRIAIIRIAIN